MNIDPRDLSQTFLDVYYDYQGRREFIREIKRKYPDLDETVIEAIWLTIDFMNRSIK